LVHRYVLSDFAKSEREWVTALINLIAEHVGLLAAGKDESFQNKVNLSPSKRESFDDRLEKLEYFLKGSGFPGISRNWRGREELYAEREDELLLRYERSRLRHRP
jgi:hypothetical protein